MRYAQGGGLTLERQVSREQLRLEAGERFSRSETNVAIAQELQVSVQSVQRWRQAWVEEGPRALRRRGRCRFRG
jgi:transposase